MIPVHCCGSCALLTAATPGLGRPGRPGLILLNRAGPPFSGSAGFRSTGHLAAR